MLIITSRWLKQFVYLAKKYEENGFMEKFNMSISNYIVMTLTFNGTNTKILVQQQ